LSIKRSRQSRATLVESAIKLPIRRHIPCRSALVLIVAKLGILPQFAHKRSRQSRATLVESANSADSSAHPCAEQVRANRCW